MLSFRRNAAWQEPSVALQQALVRQGLPFGTSVNTLRVLTSQGSYAGRSVRFFRAFDPHQAMQGDVSVRTFQDLDAHPELVVGSGHVEHGGVLSLTEHVTATGAPTPNRERADRAAHTDDEHLVFWNGEASRSSAVHLSEAAASWRAARSNQAPERVLSLPRLDRA
jgi:hypothetical protein